MLLGVCGEHVKSREARANDSESHFRIAIESGLDFVQKHEFWVRATYAVKMDFMNILVS